MALSITPGYDFTVNEVPTKAKLQSMLDNMIIKDIPRGSVDGSIAGIAFGWLTGVTMQTLANEGDTLYDLSGKLYVKTETGVVTLYNSGFGGYETVRFKVGAPTEPAQSNPVAFDNFYGQIESLTAINKGLANVFFRASTNQGKTTFMMQQVTGASGAKIRLLLTGARRSTMLWNTGSTPRETITGADDGVCHAVEKNVVNTNEWRPVPIPAFNDDSFGLGPVYAVCGSQTDTNARCPSYMFGANLMVI